MSENFNTTINETQPSSCSSNPTAETIGKTFAYCLFFFVSFAGNTVIGIIVYKTKTMRKPINFFIADMAMSDLLFPIFVVPPLILRLYTDSWLIGGSLGQAFCKLKAFIPDVSSAVSIQSLVLIAVDRFVAVVFPLPSPIISSKLCLFFILPTWIVALAVNSTELFVLKQVEYPGELVCERHWNEVFGEFSSPENYFMSYIVVFIFILSVFIAILYVIIYLKLKSQKTPGEQSANAGQQRQQRERNVLKMAIAIVLGFAVYCLPRAILFILLFTNSMILPNCGGPYFFFAVRLLSVANSAISPSICLIFSGNYRKELQALLR